VALTKENFAVEVVVVTDVVYVVIGILQAMQKHGIGYGLIKSVEPVTITIVG